MPSTAIRSRPVALPGLVLAALGVLAFSFTFPATVLAERGFDAYVVGAGRSVIAAVLAAACLRAARGPFPAREHWAGLIAVAIGCGIGFGLLSALALRHTSSSHAAVVVGLLPAATAIAGAIRTGDRPGWLFWTASGVGTAAVVAYALSRGAGTLHLADALLLARPPSHPGADALAGFAYVGSISMFLGFFAWYRGLAEAGVAKASQLQLAQPLLTIAWSAPLLGDRLGATGLVTAVVVAACVLVTQRARARRPRPSWST